MKPSIVIHTFQAVKGLGAILCLAPSWLCADSSHLWQADGNRSLELRGADGPLVRFVLDCAPRDPHFEILATTDGRNTVWVAPPDHVWHYGMWFSWKFINSVNFWEIDPTTGLQQGRSEILDRYRHARWQARRNHPHRSSAQPGISFELVCRCQPVRTQARDILVSQSRPDPTQTDHPQKRRVLHPSLSGDRA